MVMKWQHSFVWISSQSDTIEGKCSTLLPVLNFCLQMAEMKCIHIRGLQYLQAVYVLQGSTGVYMYVSLNRFTSSFTGEKSTWKTEETTEYNIN